jgi:hypothetical protein
MESSIQIRLSVRTRWETFSMTAASMSDGSSLPSGSGRNFHGRAAVAFRLLEPLAERLVVELAENLTSRPWKEALSGGSLETTGRLQKPPLAGFSAIARGRFSAGPTAWLATQC